MTLSEIFNHSMPKGIMVTRLKNKLRMLSKQYPNDAYLGAKVRSELKDLDN